MSRADTVGDDLPAPARLPRPRATLLDVATATGCAVSTVSRVLNGGEVRVSATTRQRIVEAADRLNYRPHAAARNLKMQRTGALGIVIPDVTNPVYATIVRGAVHRAEERGFTMLLSEFTASGPKGYEDLVLEQRIDGLLIATAQRTEDVPGLQAALSGVPHVFVNRRFGGEGTSVTVDDAAGAHLAAHTLARFGHTRLGLIAGPPSADTAVRRRAGFEDALRDFGLRPPAVAVGEYTAAAGYAAMLELCDRPDRPTAVFASNLLAAIGALAAAADRGIDVPGELSVIGFDDAEIARFVRPGLTTVKMPFSSMGQAGVDALLTVMAGERQGDVVVSEAPQLILRDSVAPPGL